jgi:hypothetical protein
VDTFGLTANGTVEGKSGMAIEVAKVELKSVQDASGL